MFATWLNENIGTLIIGLLLLAAVCAIVIKTVKDKKQGHSSCGCGCENCTMNCSGKTKKQQ